MSTVTYRHENNFSFKKKGVKYVINENVIDGEKGLSFSFLEKHGEDDSKFYKIFARETDKDKFEVNEKKNGKEDTKEVSMDQLLKMIKANKNLSFIDNYLSKERGNYGKVKKSSRKSSTRKSSKSSKSLIGGAQVETQPSVATEEIVSSKSLVGGAKKRSKKVSKKGSRKGSKKSSKKSSMKGLVGGAKKRSKKASKKGSKKGSRKGSKKSSMKGLVGGAKNRQVIKRITNALISPTRIGKKGPSSNDRYNDNMRQQPRKPRIGNKPESPSKQSRGVSDIVPRQTTVVPESIMIDLSGGGKKKRTSKKTKLSKELHGGVNNASIETKDAGVDIEMLGVEKL